MKRFLGVVVRGDGIGKTIGFPTINIAVSSTVEENGVFGGEISFSDHVYKGLVHIGPRPTLGKEERRIEVFLFSFSEDVEAGTPIEVILLKKIRDVQRFPSLEALRDQIARDKESCGEYFS